MHLTMILTEESQQKTKYTNEKGTQIPLIEECFHNGTNYVITRGLNSYNLHPANKSQL